MGSMYQDHKLHIYSLRREVVGLSQGMLKSSSLEKWSEDTESAITPVLKLTEERMSNFEVSSGGELSNEM